VEISVFPQTVAWALDFLSEVHPSRVALQPCLDGAAWTSGSAKSRKCTRTLLRASSAPAIMACRIILEWTGELQGLNQGMGVVRADGDSLVRKGFPKLMSIRRFYVTKKLKY
jgi:hypothetical protein